MSYRISHVARNGAEYDSALAASNVDGYLTEREAELVPALARRHLPRPVERYLDFACGSGRIMSLVAPFSRTTVGVDLSPAMMEAARRKVPHATFIEADLTRQTLDLPPFDLATAFRFFGNAEDELRRGALAAIHRHLKPGGLLITNNHRNPGSVLCRLSGHRQGMDLTAAKFTGLLDEAGFDIVGGVCFGAWMPRHRWVERRVWQGQAGRLLDRLTGSLAFAPLALDTILVARRRA